MAGSSSTAATAPFTRDLVGMSVRRSADRLAVSFVSNRGPAHAAGLAERDQIVAVDGVAVVDLPKDRPAFPGGPGTAHTLKLEGGRTVTLTLARYY
jgi:C-terminal processing protease CtpA/Prc